MRRAVQCLVILALAVHGDAKNGAYPFTKHGDRLIGPQRVANAARGSCTQCHDGLHASHQGTAQGNPAGLFAPNDNDLCFTCHAAPTDSGMFPGSGFWQQTMHARAQSDVNRCVTCHDPHGVKDADGVIPAMLVKREAELCNSCHDGAHAADIARECTKPYRHPLGKLGRLTRHVECSDCHNAHDIGASPALPLPPQASNRLAGASRVEVVNGGAGLAPVYRFRRADEPGANEYEICFKCHSSYTTQPPGQSNLALLTNPANASYHPIQAAGKNPRIDPRAFAGNYDAQSLVFCTDCHSSDTPNMRGPHGSSYRYLLKKPSTTTALRQAMQPNDICFDCHAYDVYGNAGSDPDTQRASRFAAGNGHAFHVGAQSITCYACHETHGSARHAALIATRPGVIAAFTQTQTGGTCTSSCHAPATYTVGYAR